VSVPSLFLHTGRKKERKKERKNRDGNKERKKGKNDSKKKWSQVEKGIEMEKKTFEFFTEVNKKLRSLGCDVAYSGKWVSAFYS
jgi:hypothetical protein